MVRALRINHHTAWVRKFFFAGKIAVFDLRGRRRPSSRGRARYSRIAPHGAHGPNTNVQAQLRDTALKPKKTALSSPHERGLVCRVARVDSEVTLSPPLYVFARGGRLSVRRL